jgi:hypothetical protein
MFLLLGSGAEAEAFWMAGPTAPNVADTAVGGGHANRAAPAPKPWNTVRYRGLMAQGTNSNRPREPSGSGCSAIVRPNLISGK